MDKKPFKLSSLFGNNLTQDNFDQLKNQMEGQISGLSKKIEILNSIFDGSQEGFVVLDASGAVVMANPQARNVFDMPENWQDKNICELISDASFLDKINAVLVGQACQMDIEIEQTYRISFIPSIDHGAIILMTGVTEHQTEEKAHNEFTANIAKELNQPLNYIVGLAEILGKGQLEAADINDFAKKIEGEAHRTIGMVENILFQLKLDDMGAGEGFEQFDVSEEAAVAVQIMRPTAIENKIELGLADSPCPIYGNRELIGALFVHLVSNAIRYNKPAGWVRIAVSQKNGFAYINVSDSGIGIPKEEQHRVYERFYRGDYSGSITASGAGLGLSIVRQIVRYHDGTMEIDSKVDDGTRIFIKLPQGV